MKKFVPYAVGVTLIFSFIATPISEVSAARPGVGLNQSCKKTGVRATAKSKGKTVKVKCSKVGKKLRWVQVKSPSTPPVISSTPTIANTPATTRAPITTSAPVVTLAPVTTSAPPTVIAAVTTLPALVGTVSQRNAVAKAASYLRSSAFSRTGLIEQLEYEKFTNAESIFGVDGQNADWNVQAAKKAASYLKSSSFSRSGLIDQLLYEGFTQAQAEYGVSTTGL